MKPANNSMLQALLGTAIFAALALALGWLISHPVSLGTLAATATIPLPSPAITYPPGPYVALGPSRLGAVTRLDNRGTLRWGSSESPLFIDPATDGVDMVGQVGVGGRMVLVNLASARADTLSTLAEIGDAGISGSYIVWLEAGRLHYLDRATGMQGQLGAGPDRAPKISGSVVVWESTVGTPGYGWALWSHDFATGVTITVTPSVYTSGPLVSGDWVAYSEDGALHVTNLKTREDLMLDHLRLPSPEPTPDKYYALDVPWVVWGSQTPGENPRLIVYNLDTRQSSSVSLPSNCPPNVLQGLPVNLVASGGIVLYQGCWQVGYDIPRGQFFDVPINQHGVSLASFVGWAFAKGQLVWCDMFAGQTELYTAPILPVP